MSAPSVPLVPILRLVVRKLGGRDGQYAPASPVALDRNAIDPAAKYRPHRRVATPLRRRDRRDEGRRCLTYDR